MAGLHQPQVTPGLGIIRLEPDRFLESGGGGFHGALLEIEHSKIETCFGVFRSVMQRHRKAIPCLFALAQTPPGNTQIEMRFGVIVHDFYALLEQMSGFLEVSTLKSRDALGEQTATALGIGGRCGRGGFMSSTLAFVRAPAPPCKQRFERPDHDIPSDALRAISVATAAMTGAHPSPRACRNARTEGYQGTASPCDSHRQSGLMGSSRYAGRPSAPAR